MNTEDTFVAACVAGDLDQAVALAMDGSNPDGLSPTRCFRAFLGACENGHTRVAMWLLSGGGVGDIHAEDDIVMRRTLLSRRVPEWSPGDGKVAGGRGRV
jgi:hypothetical protein